MPNTKWAVLIYVGIITLSLTLDTWNQKVVWSYLSTQSIWESLGGFNGKFVRGLLQPLEAPASIFYWFLCFMEDLSRSKILLP